jgi:hypothetical protein
LDSLWSYSPLQKELVHLSTQLPSILRVTIIWQKHQKTLQTYPSRTPHSSHKAENQKVDILNIEIGRWESRLVLEGIYIYKENNIWKMRSPYIWREWVGEAFRYQKNTTCEVIYSLCFLL